MFYKDTDAILAKLRGFLGALVLILFVTGLATSNAAADSSATTPNPDDYANQWATARYDRPAYNCKANSDNPRVTYADLSQLQPCWNSSVHIRIEYGLPEVVGGNMARDDIRLYVDLNDSFDLYRESDKSGKWDFTVIPREEENGEVQYVFYFQYNTIAGNPILDSQEYASLTGGTWGGLKTTRTPHSLSRQVWTSCWWRSTTPCRPTPPHRCHSTGATSPRTDVPSFGGA